jgi:hypothetical protein
MRKVDIDVIAPNVFQHADSEAGMFFSNDIKVRTKGDLLILEVDGIDYQYNVADGAVTFNGSPYADVPTLIIDLTIAGYANFNSGGVSPQYVDIDLTSSSYNILNYGIYEVKLGNTAGTFTMNFPDPVSLSGKTITIINTSAQDVVFGGSARFNRGTATSVVRLTTGQYSQFVSIDETWRGFVL